MTVAADLCSCHGHIASLPTQENVALFSQNSNPPPILTSMQTINKVFGDAARKCPLRFTCYSSLELAALWFSLRGRLWAG